MSAVLGISVGRARVSAVQLERGTIGWAATAPYATPAELMDVIGALAADAPRQARRVRIVLERSVVQLRRAPSPPLGRREARQYVALHAGRLFRQNGAALITDARVLRVRGVDPFLWAVAVEENLPRALVTGCDEAGLRIDAMGPATEVVTHALADHLQDGTVVLPGERGAEVLDVAQGLVVRSRLRAGDGAGIPNWVAPVAALGDRAATFASAYAAAVAQPTLSLLPPDTRVARAHAIRTRTWAVTGVALCCWLLAGALHVARLVATTRAAERELALLAPTLDSAVQMRRELTLLEDALRTMDDLEQTRSHTLALLAGVTDALGDSVFLTAFTVARDSTLQVTGCAPRAGTAVTDLGRVPGLTQLRLEGAVQQVSLPHDPTRHWERFTIRARLEQGP